MSISLPHKETKEAKEQRVVAFARRHPNARVNELAKALRMGYQRVRGILNRHGIKLGEPPNNRKTLATLREATGYVKGKRGSTYT